MVTALAVKAAVAVAALFGLSLDPRDKGLIAAVALILGLLGDAVAAHFHFKTQKGP